MICCTLQLAEEKACKLSQVIIQRNPDNPEWPRHITTSFAGRNQEAKMESVMVEFDKTGMYYLYFMFCDPHLKGTRIKGRTVWRNPSGYLPGKMAPLMVVCGLMSLAYLVLGLIWFLKFVQHWKDVIQLHYHITAVIALGIRPMGITTWAVTFTAVKKTLSRLLLLVVSMGYGVVRPTLGGITSRVLLFGGAYLVASESYELVEHLGNINDFSGKTALFLVLPVTLLDACFILWIFSSLSKTLEQIQLSSSMTFSASAWRSFPSISVSTLLSKSPPVPSPHPLSIVLQPNIPHYIPIQQGH
ncbi:hypothetical protein EUGRSUZ_A00770 [Eucalyptus grandis]|uniref:Uncharacterized protein n=2 Tax=Eucalyptus grandis TaxID=71139 RepID=A0ACC3M0S9_EUCGR|nr:hypothetical protein EUGRSUZ_A00770 [Eucalyptus grandis]